MSCDKIHRVVVTHYARIFLSRQYVLRCILKAVCGPLRLQTEREINNPIGVLPPVKAAKSRGRVVVKSRGREVVRL